MVACMVRFIFSNDNFASFCSWILFTPDYTYTYLFIKLYMEKGEEKKNIFDEWEKCNQIRRINKIR